MARRRLYFAHLWLSSFHPFESLIQHLPSSVKQLPHLPPAQGLNEREKFRIFAVKDMACYSLKWNDNLPGLRMVLTHDYLLPKHTGIRRHLQLCQYLAALPPMCFSSCSFLVNTLILVVMSYFKQKQ